MKQLLIALAFLALGMSAKAQVENLDEVELLGTWEYVSGDGIFTGRLPIYNNSYRKPVGFTFNDNRAATKIQSYFAKTKCRLAHRGTRWRNVVKLLVF